MQTSNIQLTSTDAHNSGGGGEMLSRFHLVNRQIKSACFIQKKLTVWNSKAPIFLRTSNDRAVGKSYCLLNIKELWKSANEKRKVMMYEEEFRLERWLKTCRIESLFSTYNQLNILYIIYIDDWICWNHEKELSWEMW